MKTLWMLNYANTCANFSSESLIKKINYCFFSLSKIEDTQNAFSWNFLRNLLFRDGFWFVQFIHFCEKTLLIKTSGSKSGCVKMDYNGTCSKWIFLEHHKYSLNLLLLWLNFEIEMIVIRYFTHKTTSEAGQYERFDMIKFYYFLCNRKWTQEILLDKWIKFKRANTWPNGTISS